MAFEGSVSRLLIAARSGDSDAVQQLWERYYQQLVAVARRRLPAGCRRVTDEEDIALDALNSFFQRHQNGGFPSLEDRTGLWPLLVTITSRKVADAIEYQGRAKRGGGRVRGESVFVQNTGQADAVGGLDQVLGGEPTPEFVATMSEQIEALLDGLEDPTLREIATMKLGSWTNEEIAEKTNCCVRTIERKLQLIRGRWSEVS